MSYVINPASKAGTLVNLAVKTIATQITTNTNMNTNLTSSHVNT